MRSSIKGLPPGFKVLPDLASLLLNREHGPLSLAVGNFDGFHLGHQALLQVSVNWARQHKGHSWVMSFDPHPTQVLRDPEFSMLFDRDDQCQNSIHGGARGLLLRDFDVDFYSLTALQFLDQILGQDLQVQHIVVGENFRFGNGRAGDTALLANWCRQKGIEIDVVAPQKKDGQIISSSRVREHLLKGQVEDAASILGRPYYLRGTVIEGFKRGRTLGFPTANLNPSVRWSPQKGVYVTQSRLNSPGLSRVWRSVTNVGLNPTVSSLNMKIETHILDFSQELYGQALQVEFLHKIRDERKMESLKDLQNQIEIDVEMARQWRKSL